MAKRPIVVDTTIDSPLAALGVNFAKDVPKPKAEARATGVEISANSSAERRNRVEGFAGNIHVR